MKTIYSCESCPFNVPGGEYDGYCKHPLAPNDNCQKSIYYDFNIEEENIPKTNTTDWGRYHFETNAIPVWCPLRNLKSINIGVKIKVDLDKQLFEENFITQ